jgi:hypothetical protein
MTSGDCGPYWSRSSTLPRLGATETNELARNGFAPAPISRAGLIPLPRKKRLDPVEFARCNAGAERQMVREPFKFTDVQKPKRVILEIRTALVKAPKAHPNPRATFARNAKAAPQRGGQSSRRGSASRSPRPSRSTNIGKLTDGPL